MKKLIILVLSFTFTFTFAQNINWSPTATVEEAVFNFNFGVSGEYLGEINNYKYFVYHHIKNQFLVTEDVTFCILKVQNNQIVQATPFFETKYDLLKITFLNNKISVIYIDDEDKATHYVKIDDYDPNSLTFIKTSTLYSFHAAAKKNSFKKFVFSDDKTKMAILTPAINEKQNCFSLLFKVFDLNLNELNESYCSIDYEGTKTIGDMHLSNDGAIYFNINNYLSEKDADIFSNIYFYKISQDDIKIINFEIAEDFIFNDMKFIQSFDKKNDIRFLITRDKQITFYNLDFNTENINEENLFETPEGKWNVDKYFSFSNGNSVLVLADKGIIFFSSQSGQCYINWNKNFLVLNFDKSGNEIINKQLVIRHFTETERFQSAEGNIKTASFYYESNNSLSFIYNTNPLVNKDNYSKFDVKKNTSKPIAKICTIFDNGEILEKTLFDSDVEDGIYIPGFSFLNEDHSLNICKAKKKKITFGTIAL